MILVTGATGTNGRLVVEALLRAGTSVRAMVQNPTKAADLQKAGAQLVVADFDKPDTLDGALAGVERSLLLSAVDEQLVEREARFVERAKKAGLRGELYGTLGATPASHVDARDIADVIDLTDEQLKTGLLANGQPDWRATALVELNTHARQGHASVVTDTVERVGGRAARTLEQWAEDHAAAFRS